MGDRKIALLVDDAKRFGGQSLFEPEYQPFIVTNENDALAFLRAHIDVAITLINLEASPAAGLALLTAIREQATLDRMPVWICLDPQDEHSIERSFQAGADEMIYRLPSDTGIRYQVRRFKAFPVRYERDGATLLTEQTLGKPWHRRGENPLRSSDSRFSSILNAVPGGIAMYDITDGVKLLHSNDVLSHMCNYTAREYQRVMREDYHQLIDPRDYQLVDDILDSLRKNPRRMEGMFRILTKDKSTRWVRASAAPTGDGLLYNTVFLDITQDKENEIRNEQMRNELLYRTEYDALTGIYNREAFYRRTAEMLHTHTTEPYVIMVMDIDRFRVVNDIFGKEIGDRILVSVSEGIKSFLGGSGTYARMESDHFAACFPQQMLDMERIVNLFDSRLKQENVNFHILLYFGVYRIHNFNVPVNHMCDRAAMAMKTIKGSAVNRFAFYDDKLRQAMLEENAILDEMNKALEEGQFVPYLQPVFNVDSDRPVSAEMLVRWQHPEKGLMLPGQFIPLFERNGFITKLDRYIWEQACVLLQQWKAENCLIPISVNISRIDLYYTSLCDDLLNLTRQYGVEPSSLRLEITESAYTRDPDELLEVINQLRAHGFLILMDDFGSGYSSLNVLMDMPVDILKLDFHFLARLNTNPRAGSILTSIVRMAKWLNIPIVAEGVETPEQLTFLRSIGCDHVQGYLLARPMSVANYTREFIKGERKPTPEFTQSHKQEVDLSYLWDISAQAEILFNGMIGGMGIYELVGDQLEIRRVNDGYYELLGCTPKQVFDCARNVLNSIHPDDRAAVLAACRKSVLSGRAEQLVYRHIRYNDDRPLWLETRVRFLGKAGLNDVFFSTFNDVTEKKEFERASTLRNYSLLLSSIYSGVFELNLTAGLARVVHMTDVFDSQIDSSHTLDWLQEKLTASLAWPDEELSQSVFLAGYLRRKLEETQSAYYILERQLKEADGHARWASFTFIGTPSDNGEEIYLLCIADVDSRKRSEELLLENQWLQLKQRELVRYQALMDHLGTSLFEWDMATGKTVASEGFNRYAISEFDFGTLQSYKDLERFIYPNDLNLFRILVGELLGHGSSAVILRLLDKAGNPVWCRVLCSIVKEEQAHNACFIAAIHQIDDQMKIRESYLDEQSRFQAFAENFLMGMGIFEMRGDSQRILYLSAGYRKMVGYEENERFFDEKYAYANIYPEDVPRFIEATRVLQQTGKPFTIDYRVYHKDGRLLWMRSLNSIYPAPEAGVNRIFAVIEDITELKSLYSKMNTLLTRLPVAIGVYLVDSEPKICRENQQMTDLLMPPEGEAALADGHTAPTVDRSPVLRSRADLLAHLARRYLDGMTELDETVLFIGSRGATPMRLLGALSTQDGRVECYCALVPMPDGA